MAPGIQYLAVDARRTLYECAAGWANVAGQKRMEQGTTMMLYSMSKTFTAAAALQLVESGRIGLDEQVRIYLPGIPYGDALTVRHLLSQTSGIPNPVPLKWVHLVEEHAGFDEQAALSEVMQRHGRLKFPPGAKYGYSNIAYWLLGKIIEQAAGTTFRDYLRKNVFDRLGMPPSEIDVVIPSPAHHAQGYIPRFSLLGLFKGFLLDARFFGDYEGRWFRIQDHYLNGPAFGGIAASGRMVAAFLRDQLQELSVLFGSGVRRLFYEQQKNNAGAPVTMSLGWHIGSAKGKRYYFKEGGGGGFHGEIRIYPDAGIASVVLGNSAAFPATTVLAALDGKLF
jgi:CubicO group peptidase (beta-lactamase class C family)